MDTAHDAVLLFVPHVHRAALAIAVITAFFANAGFHPAPVPHYLESIVPHLLKIVPVNIALDKMPVDIRAGGDRAVI